MRKGLFKGEVGKEEIDIPICFESFPWKEPIISMIRLFEKLTDANIDYAVEQDNREKVFNIYVDSINVMRADDALEE